MLEGASATFKSILTALSHRFGRAPLGSRDALIVFLHTRSAYVAQTALFGYLKTRMGTRHREIFQDTRFSYSLTQAQETIFLASLSDLTVFAIAKVVSRSELGHQQASVAALACYEEGVAGALGAEMSTQARSALVAFAERTAETDWSAALDTEQSFSLSPGTLVDAAPVVDQFRDLDREVVENSMRFRWIDVRRQLNERLDCAAVALDLTRDH
jgi:hypothetical protein